MQQTAELRVGNIDLFQSTYVNQTSQPNPATQCKNVRVLVRLETNREGPVKFNLWTKIGDGPSTRKYIDAWASASTAPASHKAEYAEWVEVTKTTVVQSMAEDLTNAIGQSTGWKDITLHCTGVGGGGLADAPRQSDEFDTAAATGRAGDPDAAGHQLHRWPLHRYRLHLPQADREGADRAERVSLRDGRHDHRPRPLRTAAPGRTGQRDAARHQLHRRYLHRYDLLLPPADGESADRTELVPLRVDGMTTGEGHGAPVRQSLRQPAALPGRSAPAQGGRAVRTAAVQPPVVAAAARLMH